VAVHGVPAVFYRLPSFALPYKRFVTDVICDRCRTFLGSDQSYRLAVRLQGREVVYDDRQDEDLARRAAALAPSSVWRWLSWLGNLENTLREAVKLIRQKAPRSVLHREPWPLSARKYRSDVRRQTLERAAQCLVTESLFRELFGQEIFPNFATAHGWK